MKKVFLLIVAFTTVVSVVKAQDTTSHKKVKTAYQSKIGLKAGYNISYARGSQSGFSRSNQNGFMIAGFLNAGSKSIIGYRTEIVFSRQGYTYDGAGINTGIMNDYIYLPQLTTVNITKYLQLQAGIQIGYLINSQKSSNGKNADSSLLNFMNRVDYGFAAGIEIYPFKGLIIGGRYNLGLGKIYKQYEQQSGTSPFQLPFAPAATNLKNGSVQFFIGYQF